MKKDAKKEAEVIENECECAECDCQNEDCENCECVSVEEFQKLQDELTQATNSRLQLLADFVNYRKRTEADKEEMQITANKVLLNQIIDVIDDFDRAIILEADKVDKENDFYEGMLIIRRKFTELLTNYGLVEIKAEVGDVFEPSFMEAITTAPVQDKKQINKIVHVSGKGYMNKDNKKVFRPAKVIIGK